jgi:anti-anti-sigma regulatory factor
MVVHVDASLDDVPSESQRRLAPRTGSIEIEPERDRVRVRCTGAIEAQAALEIREECEGLLERGFTCVILDLAQTTSIGPAAVSAIAAVVRRSRELGARFSVVLGSGNAAITLRRAGLLSELQVEDAPRTFLDWSR